MTTLFELQLDKHLRRKLILICLIVAFVVSVIYGVVAYRLSNDLGVDTEIRYLEKRALFLLAEVEEEGDEAQERVNELISLIQSSELKSEALFLNVRDASGAWELNQFMPQATLMQVLSEVEALPTSTLRSGSLSIDGNYFLWTKQVKKDTSLLLITSSHSIDQARAHIIKRLSISSLIVFWIAVWLALTLSSWIAKRVEGKNEALRKLATHDNLTGLPNRLYLVDLIERGQNNTEQPLVGALLLINIDKFKEVNETLGHRNGDKLLVVFSHRLHQVLAPEQQLIRSNGDEFLIWAPHYDEIQATELVGTLTATLNEPFLIDQLPIHLSITTGVALAPIHNNDIESLIIQTDIALNEARKHRSEWSIFDPSKQLEQDGQQTLRYRSELADALREQQFKLYYQPKVDLNTGQILSAEALARWHHPQDGVVPPLMFISLIEQSGKVREFGRYIIRTAIRQIDQWQTKGIAVPVAVNLSPYNLLDPDIVSFTESLLQNFNIAPEMLENELTETATSLHLQTISQSLNGFKEIGVKLSIDDFGTGMSSLAYISSLNVDTIKIDRAFVCDMDKNDSHLSIVQTALNLAKAFGCTVVAEGVENTAQAKLLDSLGCHYGQGYYYSPPIPEDKFTAMLKFTRSLPAV